MRDLRFMAIRLVVKPEEIEEVRGLLKLEPDVFGQLKEWMEKNENGPLGTPPDLPLREGDGLVWKAEAGLGIVVRPAPCRGSLSYKEVRAFEDRHGFRKHPKVVVAPYMQEKGDAHSLIVSNVHGGRLWDEGLNKL